MPLHPNADALLELIAQGEADGSRKKFEDMEPAEARQVYIDTRDPVTPLPPQVAQVANLTAPGPNGDIPMRYYRPIGTKLEDKLPVFVYFHGGGWVFGNLDTHDVIARQLANTTGFAVLLVDYRLAPETKFPGAVEDAMAAVQWAAAGGDGLNIDRERIVVGGDSAGGNLTAVVCLMARDAGGPHIAQQTLIYPATDFHRRHHRSQRKFAVGHILTASVQDWFAGHYLRDDSDKDDWRASPLLADDFSGLPPALVITAEYDPLRDEGAAFADKLTEAGVPVTYRCYPGMLHGYVGMGKLFDAANDTIAEIAAHARRVLADMDEDGAEWAPLISEAYS